jgi:hypothetical protein
MHELVINKTESLVEGLQFISISCDEVTINDQQLWFSIHAYVVEN